MSLSFPICPNAQNALVASCHAAVHTIRRNRVPDAQRITELAKFRANGLLPARLTLAAAPTKRHLYTTSGETARRSGRDERTDSPY